MNGLKYVLNISCMKQCDLAKELGTTKEHLSMLVNGRQAIPCKYLPRLAEIFNIQTYYFRKILTPQDRLNMAVEYFERNFGIRASK